ncbi:MAG TPA: phosphoadenosine phosphosulfate reductase [Erysipelotrichaceae bacterium]|nr:phosphoadenosine phosphosulfate reductase [Erysipelotrichaceae bacterium]
MDNEFLFQDRLQKIRQIVDQYGEDNFYLSFSGGKDSTILHHMIDLAVPGNRIPRVYANTGIEYDKVVEFVRKMQLDDDRIIIIEPSVNIKEMLERDGYPFKSKKHAKKVGTYQRNGWTKTAENYVNPKNEKDIPFSCPEYLKYNFSPEFKLKVDYKCCINLKEKPLKNWAKENNKSCSIIGVRSREGGGRKKAKCLAFDEKGKLKYFQPLVVVDDKLEDYIVEKLSIDLCELYEEPYNFKRTGCKGCPFALRLQEELDKIEKFFPKEYKQCEIIWKPVYDEYRRIGYRLREK